MVIALFCIAVLQLAVAAISEEIAALACLALSEKAPAYSKIPTAAYDLTAGRLPLPMPAPSKPSAAVPAAIVLAAAVPAGAVPAAQFSEADNLLAIQMQAKQKPDTQAGYRRLFSVLQSLLYMSGDHCSCVMPPVGGVRALSGALSDRD
jgi:hypothetical protein